MLTAPPSAAFQKLTLGFDTSQGTKKKPVGVGKVLHVGLPQGAPKSTTHPGGGWPAVGKRPARPEWVPEGTLAGLGEVRT